MKCAVCRKGERIPALVEDSQVREEMARLARNTGRGQERAERISPFDDGGLPIRSDASPHDLVDHDTVEQVVLGVVYRRAVLRK